MRVLAGGACNRKGEGRQHRGIGAVSLRRRDRIGRRSRQPLVKMHLDI